MQRNAVIDFHTHAFPDHVAAKAMETLEGAYEARGYSDATLAGLRSSMASAGIGHALVLAVATSPAQVRSIADWAIANSAPDVTIFGSLHPDMDDPAAEIARMCEAKIRGVKLHAEFQEFNPDEERMFPIYEALREAGMILFFHAGNEVKPLPAVRATPDRIARVLDAFPGLTVVAAHMGGYLEWDGVSRFLVGRDIYFDTSYCLHKLRTQRCGARISVELRASNKTTVSCHPERQRRVLVRSNETKILRFAQNDTVETTGFVRGSKFISIVSRVLSQATTSPRGQRTARPDAAGQPGATCPELWDIGSIWYTALFRGPR